MYPPYKNVFLIAAVMAASYWFGHTTALIPGFASTFWPAAGIALACCIRFPLVQALSGIALGFIAANIYSLSAFTHSGLNPTLLLVAIIITIGSCLQAWIAYLLWHKAGHPKGCINQTPELLDLTLRIAPLSCLVAASVGISGLSFFGFIPSSESLHAWLVWWMADTLGVVVFTPLCLLLVEPRKYFTFKNKCFVAIPTLLISGVVYGLFQFSSSNSLKSLQFELDTQAASHLAEIDQQLEIVESRLNTLGAVLGYESPPSHARGTHSLSQSRGKKPTRTPAY